MTVITNTKATKIARPNYGSSRPSWLRDYERWKLRASLEPHLETQLEFPLLEARRVHELIGIGRNRRRRIPEQIHRRRRGDARHLLGVENVLQLGDDFGTNGTADRNPARISHVHVLAHGEIQRITRDEERSIRADAVAVQIAVRRDVDRQSAVELQQDAELIAAQ